MAIEIVRQDHSRLSRYEFCWMRQLFVWGALVFCWAIGTTENANADEAAASSRVRPHWIWCSHDRSPNINVRFSKSFTSNKPIASAVLEIVSESIDFRVVIDGQIIAKREAYDPLLRIPVDSFLSSEAHELSVDATSVDGPAAFAVRLNLILSDGSRNVVVTDETWTARMAAREEPTTAVSFGQADRRLFIEDDRTTKISATDNYEQWRQALGTDPANDPGSFLLTPGFEIDLVRAALPDEGSWISMEFDPQGRLLIGKETKGLLRMTLADDGATVTSSELINDTLAECRGMVFVGKDLFVNANQDKGLFRCPGVGNDQFGEPELIYSSGGGTGHGRNDLALGPDGKVYAIHGDSVRRPDQSTDYTPSPSTIQTDRESMQGHLLRIDPKDGHVELLATGLRNPFGIDFNQHGDIFTYDADAEHDMGSPWYRPTRVSHLVTGADYGWRAVTGVWPPYYPDHPDNAHPNLDIGKGSPTAVKFGVGSSFPRRYRDALFILDWAYGRIVAVHCVPRGSSYLMTSETFLKGRPLNVTDLDFGPDGSMYFVTGGRKTQSALYRVRHIGESEESELETSQQQRAREEFATQTRKLRRELESMLVHSTTNGNLDFAWQYLAHSDPWIAYAARNILERHEVSTYAGRALREADLDTALPALMALARANQQDLLPRIAVRLNQLPWENGSRSQQLIALHTYSHCLKAGASLPSEMNSETAEKLNDMFPVKGARTNAIRVNMALCELLVKLHVPDVVAKTIPRIESTSNQAEQMHYLYLLRSVRDGWSIDNRRVYFAALRGTDRYQRGAGMPKFITQIRDDAVATLNDKERELLEGAINPTSDETLPAPTSARPFVRKWQLDEAFGALGQLTTSPDLANGEKVMRAASCLNCHWFAGSGTHIGPDLTSVARRFSRRDILASIIDPSAVIPETYQGLHIVTSDGKVHVGRVVSSGDYRSEILKLATDSQNPFAFIEIPKKQIEQQRPSTVSWMPEGLLNTLTIEEIRDLLAYLESKANF